MVKYRNILFNASKRHDNYQKIKGEKHHFNDLEEVINFLNEFNK